MKNDSKDFDQFTSKEIPADLQEQINNAISTSLCEELGIDRRTFMAGSAITLTSAMTASVFLQACKTALKNGSDLESSKRHKNGNFPDLFKMYEDLETKTPVDFSLAGNPDQAKQQEFLAQATKRGQAVGGFIKSWLSEEKLGDGKPYEMFRQLFEESQKPSPRKPLKAVTKGSAAGSFIFRPDIGPAMIFKHDHVIEALKATDIFTVDPYASQMQKATDDGSVPESAPGTPPTKSKGPLDYYMLGTDDNAKYTADGAMLRMAVKPQEIKLLRPMIQKICQNHVKKFKADGKADLITQFARLVPVKVVEEYLGVPTYETHEVCFDRVHKGGDQVPVPQTDNFTYFKLINGASATIPTPEILYTWVRDAFRNIFNNFGSPVDPVFMRFREDGLLATENLTAYIQLLINFYKPIIKKGGSYPETMLTRLLRMQREWKDLPAHSEVFQAMGKTKTEALKLIADNRIRSNVFGTVVGAVVNPEEAFGRVFDTILKLKDGDIEAMNNTSKFAHLQNITVNDKDPNQDREKKSAEIRLFALEALRLAPQGEILLRKCVKGGNDFDIKENTTVFVAHGAAMRDESFGPLSEPLKFSILRDQALEKFNDANSDARGKEAEQSQVYLQHGFGRHKCLGRYASELSLEEGLRAVMSLPDIERDGPLEMDQEFLYATSLKVKFTPS